ncbi:CRISPR-associated helicase, Cas3 family [Rhizobium sp. RU35A]|uniref:CRISPR-associated helicase Cas3' n=1 Tax=Rhizobium sp. RU35A TaxID=1907414 RepID=UPI000954C900|nr:CRISPR-associated helicase Cas3' [Rhizobium sp. RU35A]SIQ96969.1 CRISPR-associated helicase, Cas3 family [Rhizobium sp. RU35A]
MEPLLPWGKSSFGLTHHLAHHCADVAACFEALAKLPVVRNRMERSAGRALTETDISRLAALTFLHDCGKLHPGFQAKGDIAGISWPPLTPHGHVQEGAAIFDRVQDGALADALNVAALHSWGVSLGLLFAAIAHHGRPFSVEPKAGKGWEAVLRPDYAPLAAARQLGGLMRAWFPLAFAAGGAPLPDRPDFQHLFCGLVSLSDWLGSTQSLFPFVAGCDPDYMERARQQATRAVAGIGLDVQRWRSAIEGKARFELLSDGKKPRPAQEVTGAWSLDDPLVILEAETGSGKTEAALWRFAQLFEAGRVDSLYFALPTRAAARQIHQRVNDVVRRLMGEEAPEAVQAVPGYLRSGDISGKTLPAFEVLWDDDPDEARRIARWAAESGRRYLAATVAVGTVDQVMLAALQVKHAHLRAAALSRSLLVIDEIHSSDPYMTDIQSHLLTMHLERGGHAMLMSATLGAEARVKWLSTDNRSRKRQDFETAIAAPYPAVWGRRDGLQGVDRAGQHSKAVALALVAGWSGELAARHAIEAARQGAKVLVIRNTVRAAQETFEAVRELGGETLLMQVAGGAALHHSRFAAEDRRLLDAHVERLLSPDTRIREAEGVIIVGSQTLEQSLDIDADLLITDLCPVDVLLQRIGRLHRHELGRPENFEAPQCLVLSPEDGLDRLAKPAFENGLGQFRDGGGVYRNLHACELTRRLVRDHPTWVIPEMNRLLVESATHPERIDALSAELGPLWQAYWNGVYGKDVADAQSAKHLRLPVECDFTSLPPFADVEEKVRTRLGAEGARIDFAAPVTSPFGEQITGITLPSHWQGAFSEAPVEPQVVDGAITFRINDAAFRYGRTGLMREG